MNENSNSLKTENSFDSITPPFECFETKILVPTKKKEKTKKVSPCAPARAHGEQCQVKPRSRTQYSEHRLSLLFPKLRLSNFMISSLVTSAVFVQCPNVCTNWAARPSRPCVAARHYLTRLSAIRPVAGPAETNGLPKRKSTIYSQAYGPGLSLIDHQPCRLWSR